MVIYTNSVTDIELLGVEIENRIVIMDDTTLVSVIHHPECALYTLQSRTFGECSLGVTKAFPETFEAEIFTEIGSHFDFEGEEAVYDIIVDWLHIIMKSVNK